MKWFRTMQAILLVTGAFIFQAQAAELALALVVGANSPISGLTREDVRKVYLGIPVTSHSRFVKPLRNNTDPLLSEIFMQQVMFMSTTAYERQLMSRLYRIGAAPPKAYTQIGDLVEALRKDADAVTYMSRGTADGVPGIKIIGMLWQGEE